MSPIKLEFFTNDDEIIQLCELYWALDNDLKFKQSVTSLIQAHGLKKNQLSDLIAHNCRAYSQEKVCSLCSKPYILENRSDFLNLQRAKKHPNRYSAQVWNCIDCIEKEKLRKAEEQRQLEKEKRILIEREFTLDTRGTVDWQTIALENAVYFLAFVRLGASEDLSYIRPLESASQSLAPSQDYRYEIVKQLFRAGLIYVHPKSDSGAFVFEDSRIPQFYTGHVAWALPKHQKVDDSLLVIEELETICRTKNWPDQWDAQWANLWRRIALEECLEYLNLCLADHGFSLNPGEKTNLVLKNALADFSVSQMYNMIWRGAKDAAAFFVRERVSKQHAANTIVGAIQRYAERAKAEGWEIKRFGRDRRCPQSLVSQVLFNTVLQIGDDGFNEPTPPSIG